MLDWLGGTLSAMQTADDLTSLFATAAALAAGHATPRPAPEPNSALGLFLRRAGALFGRMPFEVKRLKEGRSVAGRAHSTQHTPRRLREMC